MSHCLYLNHMYVLVFLNVASCGWINDCCNEQTTVSYGGLNQIVWWLNLNHIGMSWWCNGRSGEKVVLWGIMSLYHFPFSLWSFNSLECLFLGFIDDSWSFTILPFRPWSVNILEYLGAMGSPDWDFLYWEFFWFMSFHHIFSFLKTEV